MPFDLDLSNEIVQRVIFALGVSLVVLLLVRIGQRLAKRYGGEPSRVYYTSRLIGRVGGFAIVVILVSVLSPRLGDLITVLTVIGAGLAIAMREVLLNLAGWFYVTLLTPYRQGDRIEVNNIQGDVIDIRVMRTTVMEIGSWVQADQSTGRITHIPNGWNLSHAVYNYTRGFNFIWNELPITITFRSDWEKARGIMQQYAEESTRLVEHQAADEIRQMSREFLVHYSILTPFVYVRVVENGVRLTLRYLCNVRKRRGTEHALTVSILQALRDQGSIELAYPMVGITSLEGPQFGPMTSPTTLHPGDNGPEHMAT
jgi:small-conductance mechanosensitive channel